MASWVKALAAVVVLAIVAYVVVVVIDKDPPDDCVVLAKEKSAAVNVDATVADLKLLQTKIGVSSGTVQEIDAILKDYGFKYETACKDSRTGKISNAEYNCRRDNMDRTLSAARTLGLTLAEIKNLQDPTAQKEVILGNIEIIKKLAEADFSAGCGATVAVTPDRVTFRGSIPERTITLVNGGNRDLTYHVTDLPEAFVARLQSGDVRRGDTVVVAIMRAPFRAATGEIVFHIRDNFGNKAPVRIDIDAENASLYGQLAHEVTTRAAGRAEGATVDDALAVVGDLPEVTSAAAKHFIAAGVLMEAGRFAEADKALTALSTADREFYGSASIQMTAGLLSYRLNQYDAALKHFDAARSTSSQQDGDRAELVSKSLTASVLLAQGKQEAADVYLKQPGVVSTILHEQTFLESLKDKLGLNTTVLVQRAMETSGKM